MKRNVFASLILAAVFALTACGDKDKKEGDEAAKDDTAATAGDPKATEGEPTTPPATDTTAGAITAEDEKLAEAALSYFDDLAAAATAAGDDCSKMAASIEENTAKHNASELFAKMDALDSDEAKSKALEEKYGPQMEAKLGPMMGAIQKCQDDEAVMAALEGAMPR
jgi:predicted small lipoprotein YifL